MAKITQLYQNTPPDIDNDMREYRTKLFRHRAGIALRFLSAAAAVLCVGLIISATVRNRTYTDYEVVSSTQRNDTMNTQYLAYASGMLKYSRDGVSYVNSANEASWSQTYSMTSPIAAICRNSAIVADQQGNTAYVFDTSGLKAELTTLLPIQQVCISSQGVTAMLLNDSGSSWIYLYDNEGNEIAEARSSLKETGQPLSISISPNGTLFAVSYLQVQNGAAASTVVFYNFGSVGSNFVDKIVASRTYADTVIPRVQFLSSSVCAAVSDQGLILFEGSEIPEESAVVEEETQIQSVFFADGRVGLVVEGAQGAAIGQVTPLEMIRTATDGTAEPADGEGTSTPAEEGTTDPQAGGDASEPAGDAGNAGNTDDADNAGNTDNAGKSDGKDTENTTETDVEILEESDTGEEEAQETSKVTQSTVDTENPTKYEVHLYDVNGRRVLSLGTDLDYTQVKLSEGSLILFSEDACEIYSEKGVLKYEGSFDSEISDIYRGSGSRRYVLVFSDRTDVIRLV